MGGVESRAEGVHGRTALPSPFSSGLLESPQRNWQATPIPDPCTLLSNSCHEGKMVNVINRALRTNVSCQDILW